MTEPVKKCFPPSIDEHCTRLVLGSMPGDESLRQQQYYAHPRNAFWPIMGTLFDFDPTLPYEERLAILRRHGVALWDVVGSCTRPGSLDSRINLREANDFGALLRCYNWINAIFFNGTTACNIFRKFYRPEDLTGVTLTQLPSTSPANAVLDFTSKLRLWQVLAPDKVLQ